MKIAVAGTGYVGLSVALLLSQHNDVHALDIIPEKVNMLNQGKSPIVDRDQVDHSGRLYGPAARPIESEWVKAWNENHKPFK